MLGIENIIMLQIEILLPSFKKLGKKMKRLLSGGLEVLNLKSDQSN